MNQPGLLYCLVFASYNIPILVFSPFKWKRCYGYKDRGVKHVRNCGAIGILIILVATIILICISFEDIFSNIEIHIGYEA